MKLTRKSLLLLLVVAVLAAFNAIGPGGPAKDDLPSIPAVAPESVVRVVISTPVDKMTLERASTDATSPDHERWLIVTPLQFPADGAQIRALLRTFATGIPMEALVDQATNDSKTDEAYGLSNEKGLLVELFTGGELPSASVFIGKTAAGPSSFVRLPGGDAIYRADVGGCARYERPAADWRDKMALDADRTKVVGLLLEHGGETLRFTREASTAAADGTPRPGGWTLGDGTVPVDDETVDAVIRGLSRIRASEIHNPDYEAGFEAPRSRASLKLADGSEHVIVLGGRQGGDVAFVKVDDRTEVFRTAAQIARLMTQPVASFRDRALLAFDVADVATITYADGGLTVVLSQASEGEAWEVTQPANVDADQRQVQFMAHTLATLRAAAIPADTRFDATGARITVRFRDGRTTLVEIGQTDRVGDAPALVRVRVSGREGVYQLQDAMMTEIRKAFGRG